jgi:cytochrome c oxidase assembly protein subunit 15
MIKSAAAWVLRPGFAIREWVVGMTVAVMDRADMRFADDDRAIAWWLTIVGVMVFAMVVLGGVTRLTESGLSMVDWKPLLGWLPPMSDSEWQALFERYKQFPEYAKKNVGMDLAGFQSIFWLEYLHRLLGRVIGLAFFLPMVWFWARGRVRKDLRLRLVGLFVLGGMQGVLGWVMVKSGLVDRPSVSQYRLAAHLALAVLIYAALMWTAWGLFMGSRESGGEPVRAPRWLRVYAVTVFTLICVTLVAGAFVAGLDAGLIYNTFPQMGPGLVPPDLWDPKLGILNIFENRVTVQFQHRVLAIGTLFVVFFFWSGARVLRFPPADGAPGPLQRLAPAERLACSTLMLVAGLQALLGVATLVMFVPVWLGALHQAGALLLVTAGLWVLRRFYPPA